jgi:hypothetical protein
MFRDIIILKMEIESSFGNVVFLYNKQGGVLDKKKTKDNDQKQNICINVSLSQILSYLQLPLFIRGLFTNAISISDYI